MTTTTASIVKTIILCICSFLTSIPAWALNDALKVRVTGNNYSDETVIRFVQGATPQFDGNYDAWKLFSMNPNVPSLYTQIDSVSQLSINAFPKLDSACSFCLYTKIPVAGNYTFKSFELGAFAPGISIVMKDLQTGNYYNLRDTSNHYTFNLSVSSFNTAARFVIYFSPPLFTGLADASGNSTGLTIFQQGDDMVMNTLNNPISSKTTLTVFSISGAALFLIEKNMEEHETFTFNPPAGGTYIVSLHNQAGLISKKIIFSK